MTVALILTRTLDNALMTHVVMEVSVSSLKMPPAGYHDYLYLAANINPHAEIFSSQSFLAKQ